MGMALVKYEPRPLAFVMPPAASTWVHFMDMHSGGDLKLQWSHIYIEAPTEEAAVAIFERETGRDPYNVTCSCCGLDYDIGEPDDDLVQATAHERGCFYDPNLKRWVEFKSQLSRSERSPMRGSMFERSDEPAMSLAEYMAKPFTLFIFANGVRHG